MTSRLAFIIIVLLVVVAIVLNISAEARRAALGGAELNKRPRARIGWLN